jgi:predicted transcriptional regulator
MEEENMKGEPQKAKPNNVRAIREQLLMSKSELARKAGVSVLTITRVEKGYDCRLETKRKILKALGYDVKDREKVFLNGNE